MASLLNEAGELLQSQQQDPWVTCRTLLLSECSTRDHIVVLKKYPVIYKEILTLMMKNKVIFSTNAKGRILAALFISGENKMAETVLQAPGVIGLAEVIKAVGILDAPRSVRQLEKKLALLEKRAAENPKAVKKRTLASLKTKIHNLQQDEGGLLDGASFTGTRLRLVKNWAKALPRERLEFFLLNFPTDNWKALADLVHFHRTDFELDYFMEAVYEGKVPTSSVVHNARTCRPSELLSVLKEFPQMLEYYSFLRRRFSTNREKSEALEAKVRVLTDMGFSRERSLMAIKRNLAGDQAIEWMLTEGANLTVEEVEDQIGSKDMVPAVITYLAENMPLETLLWWYHELECPEVEKITTRRVESKETLSSSGRSSYGKLMERLLFFHSKGLGFAQNLVPYAEKALTALQVPAADMSVVVMGDASGSMDVAIQSSCSLGSMLAASLDATLCFFNTDLVPSRITGQKFFNPKSAVESLDIINGVRAQGGTSMAAGLWPFYEKKTKVDLFILVSDEEENQSKNGFRFHTLFAKYREDVNPAAEVILVSFLRQGDEGLIKTNLSKVNIFPPQFRLNKGMPDTSKFESVLGLIMLETARFASSNLGADTDTVNASSEGAPSLV